MLLKATWTVWTTWQLPDDNLTFTVIKTMVTWRYAQWPIAAGVITKPSGTNKTNYDPLFDSLVAFWMIKLEREITCIRIVWKIWISMRVMLQINSLSFHLSIGINKYKPICQLKYPKLNMEIPTHCLHLSWLDIQYCKLSIILWIQTKCHASI